MGRTYKYGSFGSEDVFRDRLKCHLLLRHDWQFLDGYGVVQRCRNCGLYRTRKGWIRRAEYD